MSNPCEISKPPTAIALTPASWLGSLVCAACIAIIFVAANWLLAGKIFAEKAATYSVMPVGMTWIILAGRLLHVTWLRRLRESKAMLLGWLVLWVLGSPFVADTLVAYLENSVPNTFRPGIDPPLDVIAVLGGGTSNGHYRSQVSSAGDRVIFAAELFKASQAKQLITTGEAIQGMNHSRNSPAEQTIEIWTKLGIPMDSIVTCPGRNTYEEISHLKERFNQFPGIRMGILTSAMHLPRAMRLAKAAGLPAVPIAADVRSADNKFILWELVPQATNLERLHYCQIELMARLFAR